MLIAANIKLHFTHIPFFSVSVDKAGFEYRKDSIKRPGGYLTFINIWGGAKSRGGRLIKGCAKFIEREFDGISIRICIFKFP